jgi:ankyrin repeat protein
VKLGRNDALKMLLDFRGIEINERGDPPLCEAVEKRELKAVRLLVKQGERLVVNERTCMSGDTALWFAARDGNVEIVRALSQHHHLNPNLENHHLEHPLLLAAKRGDMQMVNALLDDGRLSTCSMKDVVSSTGKGSVRGTIQNQID